MLSKTIKRKSGKIICGILAIVLIFSCVSVSVYAVTAAEKEEYQQKIDNIKNQIAENEKKIAALKAEASTYDDEIGALQEKIDVLQKQIDLYNEEIGLIDADIGVIDGQITSIQNEIDSLNKQIKELDNQIVDIQQEIADTYTLLGQRIRASYLSGTNSSLEYLLTSNDFQYQSYLERIELLSRISDHDDKLITDLRKDIEDLQKKMAEIEDMKTQKASKISELDEMKDDLEAKKKEQVDARQVIQNAEDEIQADLNKIMSVVNKLNTSSKEYEKAIEQGEAAINEYEKKLAAQNTEIGSGHVGGMICPLQYSDRYLSSPYGTRTLNGSTRQHNGVDICCWSGTYGKTLSAAANGTVVTANKSGYGGGYGLYVVISHGNGVQTYYAHMSSVSVNVGDYVTQGTKIGAAGNTGYSFGAHLHFGVMVNGSWVNPLNYISI